MNIIEYGALTKSYGGIESYIRNQINELSGENIHFDFLVPNEPEKLAYEDFLTRKGCNIYRTYRRWHDAPIGHLIDLYKFFKIHRGKYCIAVGNYLDFQNINFLIMAKIFGMKTVAHAHSSGAYRSFVKKLLVKLNRILATYFVDTMFSCSYEAARWMYGSTILKRKKLVIIKNKIEVEKFIYSEQARVKIRLQNNIPTNAIVLGHTGRLSIGKNHSFMMDVFAEFKKKYNNSYLIFVGDGDMADELKEKANKMEIGDSILFAGRQNNIGEWLSAMDIFLFPSDHEGLPLSVIEAQTSGLKCILSECIPKETILTDLCSVLSLNMGAAYWADTILANAKYIRSSTADIIANSGYDANDSKNEYKKIYSSLLE